MNILISILLLLAGLILLALIIALLMKKDHYVKRDIIINAPRQKVFDYIKLLKNQDTFNSDAKADSERIRDYKGTDGKVGFVYSWKGNKDAGEGEKEIMKIEEGKNMEAEIRFTKPMKVSARIIFETEELAGGQTRVSWSNAGILPYPVNIMIPVMERSVAKGMDQSLLELKRLLES
jgi:hypothetical protein